MVQLTAAHTRFGEAFGFTTAVLDPAAAETDGRPQWLAARDALRTLVTKIGNHADPEIPGTEPLAAFLLGPFLEMVSDIEKAQGKAKPAEPAPAAPTPAEPTKPG